MSGTYVANVGISFAPDPTEPILESIFQQYERVIVESLITSFGLDFLVKDQHGGDVDTIHNVRQIGQDEKMTYKNVSNQRDYEQQGEYDRFVSKQYHEDKRYKAKNNEVSELKKSGQLVDAYTGKRIERSGKTDLDHVISAKEIHDDRGRVLADLAGVDLANCEENLKPTQRSINRSMKQKSADEYLQWLQRNEPERVTKLNQLRSKPQSELTDKERATLNKYEQLSSVDPNLMKKSDRTARKSYEAKLRQAYYTSPKFGKDLALAAGNTSVRMGARQALGFVFAEMWFAVKEEFQSIGDDFELGKFFKALGRGIKQGFERAKEKFAELFSRFFSGAVAGALSSLTTTLCNIFFTTAKNTVRVIRQTYASLVEAGKVLFINPDNYTFGDRMKAVVKILATGASVVAGVIVSEAIGKTPVGAIPVLGDIIQTFCGSFVTGIMSCTLLYFFDRSELMQKLFKALDNLHTIETEINYYRQQADYFERYAAELMEIDLEQFKKEALFYESTAIKLEGAKTEDELNSVLKQALKEIGIAIPWSGYESFDKFMSDKSARLVFE